MNEYVPLSEGKIRELARDTYKERVFWSTAIPEKEFENIATAVFMPLMLVGEEVLDQMAAVRAIPYEYMSEAGPRSVNGYPTFFSMRYISADDYNRVRKALQAITAAVDGDEEETRG